MKKRMFLLCITICLMVFAIGVASASAEVTWNPADKTNGIGLSNNNLTTTCSTWNDYVRTTTGTTSGKWYWEVKVDQGTYSLIGVANSGVTLGYYNENCRAWYQYGGNGYTIYPETNIGTSYAVGDVIGIALDMDNGTLSFYKNGINQNITLSLPTSWNTMPYISSGNADVNKLTANFGATPFTYTIPEGYQSYDGVGQVQAPTNLVATAGNAQVSLSWTAVSGATSYKVKRSTTTGGPYTEIAANVTTTTYTDTTVTNGTTYYYVVTAVTSGGESGNSNEVSATPQAGTTPPPSGVGNALLRIIMVDSSEREYQLTMTEVNAFISWFETKGAGTPYYMFNKTYNVGPFTSRKNYVAYDKIIDFEVMQY